ncbi:hypothetical protein KTQ81_17615 [Salmonella enterica subsp. diarizonae]|nr:hypothetical protein [Salmonella enterica subsp. diarizonae]
MTIGNRLIRREEKVTLWWASANRDDAYYEQPFAFDIGRQKNLHMAFGGGGTYLSWRSAGEAGNARNFAPPAGSGGWLQAGWRC